MSALLEQASRSQRATIPLALACDLRLVRAGFQQTLARQRRYDMRWSGGVEQEDRTQIALLQPWVTILDVRQPGNDGLELLRTWCRECPSTQLLLLRPLDRAESLALLFEAGASGLMAREDQPWVLRLAIEALAQGQPFLARSLRGRGPLVRWLSSAEQDLLRDLALGRSFSELAAASEASLADVREAGQRLMTLLGCSTRADILRLAIRQGLLPRA